MPGMGDRVEPRLTRPETVLDDAYLLAPLYVGAAAWTVIYDTIYAFQDTADDAKVGVKSTARRFADAPRAWLTAFWLVQTVGVGTSGLLLMSHPSLAPTSGVGWGYVLGAAAMSTHVAWQVRVENGRDETCRVSGVGCRVSRRGGGGGMGMGRVMFSLDSFRGVRVGVGVPVGACVRVIFSCIFILFYFNVRSCRLRRRISRIPHRAPRLSSQINTQEELSSPASWRIKSGSCPPSSNHLATEQHMDGYFIYF